MIALSYHAETDSSPHPFNDPSPLNREQDRTRVAICGFEEQNDPTAPYDDPEWDVWGFNMANRMGFMRDSLGRFRADVWFDLHEEHAQNEKDLAWINACPVPIYLTHRFGTNPLARVYQPEAVLDAIAMNYRHRPEPYFSSSFAYAVALALAQGYQRIGLFGVNLDWGRERVVERGNLEYWIGFAQGCGVTIELSGGSKLLTHPGLYGIEYTREKEGVEGACAEVVRQLLQSPGIKDKLDRTLRERTAALEQIQRTCANLVERLVYQSPVKP